MLSSPTLVVIQYSNKSLVKIVAYRILSKLGSPDTEIVIKKLRRVRDTIGEQIDIYWKTITNSEVPDFIKSHKELEDLIQYILSIVRNKNQEEITKVTESIKTLLKESEPNVTQFLHVLLDILSGKDVSNQIPNLTEPFKSLLEKYMQ